MIRYDRGQDEYKDWIVSESDFNPSHLRKLEAVMALGNGYMGLRSSLEEAYPHAKRNLFVNGTFNQADPTEVTELPNLADVTQIDFLVDGTRFHLEIGEIEHHTRDLNVNTAELSRDLVWKSPEGKRLHIQTRRIVSLAQKHLIANEIKIKALDQPVALKIISSIDGQTTNSGAQHFLNGTPRVYGDYLLEYQQTTRQSEVEVVLASEHRINQSITVDKLMERRKVGFGYNLNLESGESVTMEKFTAVYTSRDREFLDQHAQPLDISSHAHGLLKELTNQSYEEVYLAHKEAWKNSVWNRYNLHIDSEDNFDQLATRFSMYHMSIMTPAHDDRMGIGAKGLSGEGYKGHSFWDTEIFVLPFFTYSNPSIAKSLLTYRYHGLESARKKAKENGYEGAMYPWEMAFPDEGEVTPLYGDIDIVTGERSKIWTGLIEQHITADIAFAVDQYVRITGDQTFLNDYGYEMIFECANFWASRLEWNAQETRYEITNVIGPDEYKEHINNNAYTNYLAYFTLKLAKQSYEYLSSQNENVFEHLKQNINLAQSYQMWQEKASQLYLPEPKREQLVIPQDDTYLDLPEIDLTKYRNQPQPRTIYKDYNQQQINGIQVTKQADVLVLIYLLEQTSLKDDLEFTEKLKRANFDYYEPRTLHDSSLSLSTHAILASDLNNLELAYKMFQKASRTDLGENMQSSQEGIHAASIAGIWNIAVFGFGGVRLTAEGLSIQPKLPKQWSALSFNIDWKGEQLRVNVQDSEVTISKDSSNELELLINNQSVRLEDTITVPLALQNI
ncbi:glycoside hydrolase family 65 protein [Halalkalibacillus halophilus]|uniref:glycoside hydrolase family 65 protein n=1 Tax=Halalkalibacillus halophilus TaxID=392827 RepID=UPI0004072FCD|nr:glycosyl hydrolase family 65 protein [Halalkalibacillus halophilus]